MADCVTSDNEITVCAMTKNVIAACVTTNFMKLQPASQLRPEITAYVKTNSMKSLPCIQTNSMKLQLCQ